VEQIAMARKSTIGANPLDAVVPSRTAVPARRNEPEPQPEPKATRKERVTFQLPVDLIEQARDAVYWTPGATMAGLMERAFKAELGRLEQERKQPFPSRAGEIRTGRPVKAA
jgi:hypothetical protein